MLLVATLCEGKNDFWIAELWGGDEIVPQDLFGTRACMPCTKKLYKENLTYLVAF